MNTVPGSALLQAASAIRSQIFLAFTTLRTTTFFPKDFQTSISPSHFSSYSGSPGSGKTRGQSASFSTACINLSDTQTERLAPLIRKRSCLTVINSSRSGCQSHNINIRAPLLVPPCWMISLVATENNSAQLQGPDEKPFTFLTREPLGRSDERLMPTPPPRAMISTICFSVSKIPSRESLGLGITKQL